MKIGVDFGEGVPHSGGQFTFQSAVSKALGELAPSSRHKFVVGGTPNLLLAPGTNVELVPLDRSFTARAASRLYRHASSARKRLMRQDASAPEFREAKPFIESGVDMMWYVGPFCYTMEIPYIYTLLDLQHLVQPFFPEVSNNGIWFAREKHYATALRRAARIVVSTHVGKQEIERFYQVPGERIVVLPYAAPDYDLTADSSYVLAKYNLEPGYLFYPAQFWPQKNHVGLLEAVRILRERWNIDLTVVFSGSDKGNRAHVESCIVRLGLHDRVKILGFIPSADITALYRNALALSMPTLVGPDNIPSLEAFALGCPVVTSNLHGFEEQLGNAALLVKPTDEVEIAAAIKSLYENPERRRDFIEKGKHWVARWSWRNYVEGVLGVFDEMHAIRRTWPSAAI